jgi:surfeit locus 1 family protein
VTRAIGLPPRRPRLILPGAFAFIGIIILLLLGTWQLERKTWKDELITRISERLAGHPGAVPGAASWPQLERSEMEFRPVHVVAEFLNDREVLVYTAGSTLRNDVRGPGYWVFTPARLSDGAIVFVNRGFVPEGRQDPATRRQGEFSGLLAITGIMRWPDPHGFFMPRDDPAHKLFFARDPGAIARAENLGVVAPFYIEQEAPRPLGGLPSPATLRVNLPNNHLQYAVTWYALAAGLLAVFTLFALSQRWPPGR